jgi:hypothetical protein
MLCNQGFADCANGPSDGCETNIYTNPQHCNGCNHPCQAPTPNCVGGACVGCLGTFIADFGGQSFYKVQVNGTMTDTNVYNACIAAACRVPCDAQPGCGYNDNLCIVGVANDCPNPMLPLSQAICATSPSGCAPLLGVYQYMGHGWGSNDSCGAESGMWCAAGSAYSNRFALCIQ